MVLFSFEHFKEENEKNCCLLKSFTWVNPVCELRGGLPLGWGSRGLQGDSETAEEVQMQTFGCQRKLLHTCTNHINVECFYVFALTGRVSLAPQSSARSHIRGVFRDFQPIPVSLIAFEHLSLYIQKNLSQSVTVCGSLWQLDHYSNTSRSLADHY